MTPELRALHLAAGLRAGLDRTCVKKVAYSSETSAGKAADAMNAKPDTRNVLEAYPCPFCDRWHVGRKLSDEELREMASKPFSDDELADLPTSVILRDVIAHGCDRYAVDQLCDRCRDRWAEVDRRLPTRKLEGS